MVYDVSIPGCPLSRGGERRWAPDKAAEPVAPVCRWWDRPDSERAANLAAFAPDVVVVHAGLNELLDRRPDGWSRFASPDDPALAAWLATEYRALDRVLVADGARPVHLTAVCADWPAVEGWRRLAGPDRRVAALDRALSPATLPGTTFADLGHQLCPHGYTTTVAGVPGARFDGFHFRNPASERLTGTGSARSCSLPPAGPDRPLPGGVADALDADRRRRVACTRPNVREGGGATMTTEAAVRAALAPLDRPGDPRAHPRRPGHPARRPGRRRRARSQVDVTPTYSGCPAMDAIRDDIVAALTAAGVAARRGPDRAAPPPGRPTG